MTRVNRKPNDDRLAIIESADLLPPQFSEQRQVYRAIYAWTALTLASGAILAGTFAAFWAQAKQNESDRTRMIADAAPLKQVRNDVLRMQSEIQRLQTSCTLVESAKPSDELLQSLAAITVVSNDVAEDVMVDSVNVRLALEYPKTEDAAPKWAQSELSITMTSPDDQVMDLWIERLDAIDRIENPLIGQIERTADSTRTTVTATPLAITDLP